MLAVVAMIFAALLLLGTIAFLGWYFVVRPGAVNSLGKVGELFELAKIALAVTGGLGGVVAIVVAFRRQRVQEADHELAREANKLAHETHELASRAHDRDDIRILNERFTAAANLLGSKDSPAIRMAGVQAMASLADDWEEERQMCIDVLCSYLRLPNPVEDRSGEREIRRSIISAIRQRLQEDVPVSWDGAKFDFTRATLDTGDFGGVQICRSFLNFSEAIIIGEGISFSGSTVDGGIISFSGAAISGNLNLDHVVFSSGTVSFQAAVCEDGSVTFNESVFMGAVVTFESLMIKSGSISFDEANFFVAPPAKGGAEPLVRFNRGTLSGGHISFDSTKFDSQHYRKSGSRSTDSMVPWNSFDIATSVSFGTASLLGSRISFKHAEFRAGLVDFGSLKSNAGYIDFEFSRFKGGKVAFDGATLGGGVVSFDHAVLAEGNGSDYGREPEWLVHLTELSPEDIGHVLFKNLEVPQGDLSFWDAELDGAHIDFADADLRGGTINFVGTRFSSGLVSMGRVAGRIVLNLWRSSGLSSENFEISKFSHAVILIDRFYGPSEPEFPEHVTCYRINGGDYF